MPAHQRLRLEDNRGFAHGGEQPIEPDEDQAICSAQPEPRRRGSLQDDKLLAKKCRLGFASRMRSEHSDEHSAEQLQEVKHPEARIAHRGICASPDTIFGSHRRRLHALAPGLTPRSVLEKFAAMQMIDVHLPTTDGRELVLTRYTEPEP